MVEDGWRSKYRVEEFKGVLTLRRARHPRGRKSGEGMAVRAAAARSSTDWEGSGISERLGERTIAELGSKAKHSAQEGRAGHRTWSVDGQAKNLLHSWATQSINGLCRFNHEYPSTAEAEQSRSTASGPTGQLDKLASKL